MAILKRQRARKARKVVKATGITYGAAVRLVKHLEVSRFVFESTIEGAPVAVPTFCDCCGPATSAAVLLGPKGKLRVEEIKAF